MYEALLPVYYLLRLLYQYKSTNTDRCSLTAAGFAGPYNLLKDTRVYTGFTSTKVPKLTPEDPAGFEKLYDAGFETKVYTGQCKYPNFKKYPERVLESPAGVRFCTYVLVKSLFSGKLAREPCRCPYSYFCTSKVTIQCIPISRSTPRECSRALQVSVFVLMY